MRLLGAALVRDEGVAGSNPATPTSYTAKPLVERNYLQKLNNQIGARYTSRSTNGTCAWSVYAKTAVGTARKRLPDDVREEYGRLFGARFEAKFSELASVGRGTADQRFTAASYWQRALLVVGGLLLIEPGIKSDIIGAVLAGVVIVRQVMARRAARSNVASGSPTK